MRTFVFVSADRTSNASRAEQSNAQQNPPAKAAQDSQTHLDSKLLKPAPPKLAEGK